MMEHPETESTVPGEVRADRVSMEIVAELTAAEPSLGPSPIRHGPSGRRLYSLEELPPRVRLRVEHAGKWVAWSADRETIIASAENLRDLLHVIDSQGRPSTIYEWLGD